MKKHSEMNRGSLMVPMFLLMVILVPMVLVFARWVLIHRKMETQSRVHGRQYYAAEGAAEVALHQFRSASPAWRAGTTKTFKIHVDTATVVEINISTLGS